MSNETTYHNTTNLQGEELRKKVASASKCKEAILTLFMHQRGRKFTASKVYVLLTRAGHKWSLNGVRGRVTDLMKEGHLEKLSETEPGSAQYKEPEHMYTLNQRKHPTPTGTVQQSIL